MNKVFRPISIIIILLIGILLTPGACTSVRPTPVPPTPTPSPTPKSTVFITSNLTIEPQTIRDYDSAVIGVTVTNTGEQPGTYTVVLRVKNNQTSTEDVLTQDVTLNGGASRRVTFDYFTSLTGHYVVTVDQLQGFLDVQKAA